MFEPREAVGSDPAPGLTRIGGQGPWAPGPRMTVYAPERAGASRWQRRATQGAVPLASPPPPAPGHFPLPSPLSRQSSPRRQPRGPSPQKPLPKRFRYGLPQTSLRAPRKATGKASFLQSPFTPEAPPDRDIYASLVLPEFGKGRGAQPRGEKWGNSSWIPLSVPEAPAPGCALERRTGARTRKGGRRGPRGERGQVALRGSSGGRGEPGGFHGARGVGEEDTPQTMAKQLGCGPAGLEKAGGRGGEAGWKGGSSLAGRGRGSHVRPRGEAPAGRERTESGNWLRQELSLSWTEGLDVARTP